MLQRSEILECHLMTGDADFLLRVVVPDVEAYERFLRDWLARVESVSGIKSSFALKEVKDSTSLPLDGGRPAEEILSRSHEAAGGLRQPPRRPAAKKGGSGG